MMNHGEVYMLKELFEPNTLKPTVEVAVGKCVRVCGILQTLMISRYLIILVLFYSSLFIIIISALCIIEHEGSCLLIDIRLVDMSHLQEGHLYQFIGEIKGNLEKVLIIVIMLSLLLLSFIIIIIKELPKSLMQRHQYYLETKVVRNIDGMDLNLYAQAILARRKFLQTL